MSSQAEAAEHAGQGTMHRTHGQPSSNGKEDRSQCGDANSSRDENNVAISFKLHGRPAHRPTNPDPWP